MKTKLFLTIVGLLLPSAVSFAGTSADSHLFPDEFESRGAAEKYIHALSAGGEIRILRVNERDVLIISQSGSGVPDIAFAAYLREAGKWALVSELKSPSPESHKVVVSGESVLLFGEKSRKQWQLVKIFPEHG